MPIPAMQHYFTLQFRRLQRHLRDAGLNPAVGMVLALLVFVAGSEALFRSVELAAWLYPLIAAAALNPLAAPRRMDFLRTCFPPRDFWRIRLAENLLAIAPFLLFALARAEWWTALTLPLIAVTMLSFSRVGGWSPVLPTPFGRRPFEFVVGFRRAVLLFLLAYALTGIAVAYDNFNLGVFAMLLPYLICLNFYTQPEPKFYVWVHAGTPAAFLNDKLRTAAGFSFALALPPLVLMLLVYPDSAWLLVMFAVTALMLVGVSLLGKYAYYPSDMNLVQGMAIGACLLIPPAMLLILPHFYHRARQNLEPLFV